MLVSASQKVRTVMLFQGSPFRLSLLLSAFVLLALSGCDLGSPGETPVTAVPTAPPPTATPLPRGGNLTLAITEDLPRPLPWAPTSRAQEQLFALVYRAVMRLGPDLAPQPDLAERFDASPDGLVLTFTMRTGLTWHDGAPLGAEDAAWTIRSLRELSATTALIADLQRYVADVAAPDQATLVLTLTERYAPLLAELATPVLPSHLLRGERLDQFEFWRTPVGSGPFQLEEYTPGESILLSASPTFYGGEPLLSRVALIVSPNPQVTRRALDDGRVLLSELDPATAAKLSSTPLLNQALQYGGYAENGYYFLAFNALEGRLFADGRLRRALALAVDVPALVDEVAPASGMLIGNSAAPGSWADLTPPPTATVNLEQAGALLDDSGWLLPESGAIRQKNGAPLVAQLFVRSDDPRRLRAAQQIAEAGRSIGMDIQVQPADFATVILGLYAPPFAYDLLLASWVNGAASPDFADYQVYDPDDFGLFHSSQINQGEQDLRPALRNFVGWRDAAYDNQAQAGRQLYNLDERKSAFRQTQARVASELPYLFLWADRIAVVANQRVRTLDGPLNLDTPAYLWNVERWYLAE
jgi:peptide/nickel transport system substrate-binding protein